jgi:hypothetical protein
VTSFHISLETSTPLYPGGDPGRFVSTHVGEIRRIRDRDGRHSAVGMVRAHRVHADAADEARETLLRACDAHSQELREVYAALFDPATDDLREPIRARFGVLGGDLLVLDYVLLSPRWRGLDLGLAAARRVIDLLGGGCGLVAARISPLNADAAEFAGVPAGWIPTHGDGDEGEAREARRKLRRHFRRLGFRRVAGTRFHAMPPSRGTPTMEAVVGPVERRGG